MGEVATPSLSDRLLDIVDEMDHEALSHEVATIREAAAALEDAENRARTWRQATYAKQATIDRLETRLAGLVKPAEGYIGER